MGGLVGFSHEATLLPFRPPEEFHCQSPIQKYRHTGVIMGCRQVKAAALRAGCLPLCALGGQGGGTHTLLVPGGESELAISSLR